MRKFITRLLLIPIGAIAVILAIANRQQVEIFLDPLSSTPTLSMPLFIALFIIYALGAITGGIVVWFRQGAWRKAARSHAAEIDLLKAEQERLQKELHTLQNVQPENQHTLQLPAS